MAARPAILRQAELARYAKAMRQAGVDQWRVVARPDGSHELIVGKSEPAFLGPDPDELLK